MTATSAEAIAGGGTSGPQRLGRTPGKTNLRRVPHDAAPARVVRTPFEDQLGTRVIRAAATSRSILR
jgi:hypothetical protein